MSLDGYQYPSPNNGGRRKKSKWEKAYEEKVGKHSFLDFTFALLLAAAFGLIGWSLGIIKLPANHAKSADEVAAERAVESQNKAIQERKRRRKR